jgi:predicted acylesterase/phospholipase RssA
MDIKNDFDKLIRFVTGNARGLVLSGGGARAVSHIGVLRALEEAHITFDIVAGSSMGAWIAGYYAMGMDYKEIMAVSESAIKSYLKKTDYTFPFVSITGGKPLTEILQNSFGEIRIEDLSCRFFCVSTNLTQGLLHTHSTGLLWKSVKASLSLPALLPPIVYDKNQLFVDGSVMNNLPVDIMRDYMNGGKITASSLDPQMKNREYNNLDELSSGWKLLWRKLNPYSKLKSFPNVGQIITSSVLLSSSRHQKKMLEIADSIILLNLDQFSLMEFKSYQAIIEKGYEIAVDVLSKKNVRQ